jgi:hypothetical protein
MDKFPTDVHIVVYINEHTELILLNYCLYAYKDYESVKLLLIHNLNPLPHSHIL